jgi:alkaline phosphatase D
VAEDEGMGRIVQTGTATAAFLLGHSVHAEVTGLRPDRWYWYRFRTGDAVSPVGRTRTLPEPGARPSQLRFAFASCQHYETGLFTAYQKMAEDDLDLIVHLGDYIYEGAAEIGHPVVRRHIGPRLASLADYRIRHAQYRADPMLQAAHARFPWFVTWDDHEVRDNYSGDFTKDVGVDRTAFLIQRANAYQVYYEQMPLRRRSIPRGPDMQLYRTAAYGAAGRVLHPGHAPVPIRSAEP